MKSKMIKNYSLVTSFVLATYIFTMSGCGNLSCGSNVSTAPAVLAVQKVFSIQVVDTTTGNNVENLVATVYGDVSDASSRLVLPFRSLNQSVEVKGVNGIISFYTNKDYSSESLRIIIKADEYLDTGIEIKLDNENREISRKVKMVKLVDDANDTDGDGIAVKTEKIDKLMDETGVASKEIEVVSNKASVTIPKGIKLLDKNGNALEGSDVKVVVTSFEANSTDSFPGGLNVIVADVPSEDNTTKSEERVNMISAGFTSIIIENSDGDRAKNVENAKLTIRMDISNATNPKTGNPVKIGDIIPIWSYDETTGKWSYEGEGTVESDVKGLYVEYETSHLTYYNLDYFRNDICDTASININGGEGFVTNWNFSMAGWSHSAREAGEGVLKLFNSPKRELDVNVTYLGNSVFAGKVDLSNCSADITLKNMPSLADVVDTPIKFLESCPNSSVSNPIPNVSIYDFTSRAYYGTTDSSGTLDLKIISGSNGSGYYWTGGFGDRYTNVSDGQLSDSSAYGRIDYIGGNTKTVIFTLKEELCQTLPPVVDNSTD